MIRRLIASVVAMAALSAITSQASAHEFRPALLDITDRGGGRYEIVWKAPENGGEDSAAEPALAFPADCRREPGEGARFTLECPSGLAGRAVTVRGLGAARGDALVRYTGPGGPATTVLRADNPTFTIPTDAPRASSVTRARGYFTAGIAHILAGADHLLFVLGLLLLVGGGQSALGEGPSPAPFREKKGETEQARDLHVGHFGHHLLVRGIPALVRTITAFTLAHSLTLALAVTAAVRLPPAPVEAVIALSLVLLAGELTRSPDHDQPPTLARRRPALLAFAFGLLHGFGFAGGLADLRVPAADLPLALAGFNLGVEAGQLAFVAASIAAFAILRRTITIPPPRAARLALVPAYLIGSLGAFFCLDRVARLWSS